MPSNKVSSRNSNTARKSATVFGAALSTAFVAPEIQADVLDITWDGGQASVAVDFYDIDGRNGEQLTPRLLDIDQLGIGDDLRVNNTFFFNTFPQTYYGMGQGTTSTFVRNVRGIGPISILNGGFAPGDVIDP